MSWNIDTPIAEYYDHQSPGLEALIKEVAAQKEVALDTETTGLVRWRDKVLYWSLAWGQRRVTLNVSALPYFKEVFADPYKIWIFANAKYDLHILANMGVFIAGKIVDVQVQHALLYEDRRHKLKLICEHILGWRWSDFQDTFGKIGARQSAEDLIRKAERENFGLLVEYAANDAWGTLNVKNALDTQLSAAGTYSLFADKPPYIRTLHDLFYKVEVPYTKVLWHCERKGTLMNMEYMRNIAPTAEQEIVEIHQKINKEVGWVINPNSVPQLRKYFFDQLGLKPLRMTAGGKSGNRLPSCDEKFLEYYRDESPVAEMMLRHRELSKLFGTYIRGMSELIDDDGRLHTQFNQDIARTGRLSSSEPNVQNIPRPDNDKWKIRGAFVAPPGYELIVADYEQLEMRLLACASLEQDMIDVINNGWDIHMGNASMIFGLPYEDIENAKKVEKKVKSGALPPDALTPYMHECLFARATAKTLGFGLVYGMGVNKLARDLGVSKHEAEKKIETFQAKYPAVAHFTEEAVAETDEYGYAFTIMGRRRNVPEINSTRRDERQRGERIAVNTPIQGSAADVVKMAQILCFKARVDKKYGAEMNLQVHDELMFECPKETVPEAMEEIKEWMEHPFVEDLAVPLAVDIGHGQSWMEAK